MITNKFVTVLLPANNEEKNLPMILDKINNTFKKHRIKGEGIVINDGSDDGTEQVLKSLTKKFRFLKYFNHLKKEGMTECVNTGGKHAKGYYILFMPSDLQAEPEEDIPKLLRKIEEGYDLVCGVRKRWDRPTLQVIQSKIYSLLSRLLFKVKIKDFNWERVYKSEILKGVDLRKGWHRYFVVLAASKGYKVGQIEVIEHKRDKGKSKTKIERVVTGFLDMVAVKFFMQYSEKPLHFFSIPAFFFIAISVLIAGYGLIVYGFDLKQEFNLYFTSLILLLFGIHFIAIGFLGETIKAKSE